MDNIFTPETIESLKIAFQRLSSEAEQMMKPFSDLSNKIHDIFMEQDENYARKYRHRKRYYRMMERMNK